MIKPRQTEPRSGFSISKQNAAMCLSFIRGGRVAETLITYTFQKEEK